MKARCGIAAVILGLLPLAARAQEEVEVTGRVLDAAGKPVAGADVATYWNGRDDKMKPYQGAITRVEGRFTLAVAFRGRKKRLMALDKERKTGGLAWLEEQSAGKPVEIKLTPLVHVHGRMLFTELEQRLRFVNLFISSESSVLLRSGSTDASFSFRLPPDDYRLRTLAPGCQAVVRTFSLKPDALDLDLGTLDVPASILTKHKGKTPPAWHVTDARGVKKDVKLSDFKGKWVLLDFWGHWCGPCTTRSLPRLIDLYEAHKKDRAKFEILAFHDSTAKDFAELDKKMERPRNRFWGGHDLPFPILLDATGQTIEDWGVEVFPTTLLIDPEGKLVGEVKEDVLEEKLPPLPMSVRVARALDRNVGTFRLEKTTLDGAVQLMSRLSNVPIRLDLESLKAAGIAPDAIVPLEMTTSITLRSALNLLLEAHNLTYTRDDKGLVIKAQESGTQPAVLSERQRFALKRLEKVLDEKVSFDFKNKTLEEVATFFRSHAPYETVVLSPRDRKAGRLDPKATVTCAVKDLPLREALTKLLKPLGMGYTIRDEVIVLTAKSKATK